MTPAPLPIQPGKIAKVTLLLASSLTVMAGAAIAPAMPGIATAFPEAGSLEIRLILTLPGLFIALFSPFSGALLDFSGRKPVFIAGLGLYALAGTAGLYLNSTLSILISRAFLGLSVACIMSACITLIADFYAGLDRERMMSLQAATMSGGGIVFLTLGGFLATFFWRLPFWIYLASSLLIVPALHLPEPTLNKKKQLFQFPEPFRTAVLYASGYVFMLVFYSIPVELPFYLKELGYEKPWLGGLAIALATVTSALSSVFFGKIKTRLRFKQIYFCCFSAMAAGFMLLATGGALPWLLAGLALVGSGMGLYMPATTLLLVQDIAPEVRGRVVGGAMLLIFAGQFSSPFVSRLVAGWWGTSGFYFTAGIFLALSGGVFLSLVGKFTKD